MRRWRETAAGRRERTGPGDRPRRPRKRGSPTRTPRPVFPPFLWFVGDVQTTLLTAGSGGRLFLYLALKIYPAGSPGPLHTRLGCTAWRLSLIVDRLVVLMLY